MASLTACYRTRLAARAFSAAPGRPQNRAGLTACLRTLHAGRKSLMILLNLQGPMLVCAGFVPRFLITGRIEARSISRLSGRSSESDRCSERGPWPLHMSKPWNGIRSRNSLAPGRQKGQESSKSQGSIALRRPKWEMSVQYVSAEPEVSKERR